MSLEPNEYWSLPLLTGFVSPARTGAESKNTSWYQFFTMNYDNYKEDDDSINELEPAFIGK